jgi:hypothetical protein
MRRCAIVSPSERKRFHICAPNHEHGAHLIIDYTLDLLGLSFQYLPLLWNKRLRESPSDGAALESKTVQCFGVLHVIGVRKWEIFQVLDLQLGKHAPFSRFDDTKVRRHQVAVEQRTKPIQIERMGFGGKYQEEVVAAVAADVVNGSEDIITGSPHENLAPLVPRAIADVGVPFACLSCGQRAEPDISPVPFEPKTGDFIAPENEFLTGSVDFPLDKQFVPDIAAMNPLVGFKKL